MQQQEAQEIIACLPSYIEGGRTLFHYPQDGYALWLLQQAVGQQGCTIGQIKSGPLAKLLNKPAIKAGIKNFGDGTLTTERLQLLAQEATPFALALETWNNHKSRWLQTTREGKHSSNLVLQLNFSGLHDGPYRHLLKPSHHARLNNYSHPVSKAGRETLAWVRIDLDFNTDEALIEEVQSDWVRDAKLLMDYGNTFNDQPDDWWGLNTNGEKIHQYINDILAPYLKSWAEAALTAALFFIHEELGINQIWYHSFETGNLLKRMEKQWAAPRSLYSTLPRRFCFEAVSGLPEFLANDKSCQRKLKRLNKRQQPQFYRWGKTLH